MIEILKDRALLNVIGKDAGKFLQGMTTNDIIKNVYSYNYLLSNQGRYLFDFFVYQQNPTSYFIDIHHDSADSFAQHIIRYKLRSNFEINNLSSDYSLLYSRSSIDSKVEFSMSDTRYDKLSYRTIIKKDDARILNNLTDNLYIEDKYNYGIVDGYSDLIYNRSIPPQYGAEELNAISYNKGCYIGQEVISRIKYQSVVRKKIFILKNTEADFSDFCIKEDAVVDSEFDKLGVICSYYKNLAIALLNEDKFLNLSQPIATINKRKVNITMPPWRE